jgi:hypothetical protein
MTSLSPRNLPAQDYIAHWGELSSKLLKHDRREIKEKAKQEQILGLESLAIAQQHPTVVPRQSPSRRYVTLRQVQTQPLTPEATIIRCTTD